MFPKSYILRNFFKRLALFTVFSGSRAATVPLPTAQGEAASHHSAAATCRSRPSQASADTNVGRLSCGGQTAPRPWGGAVGWCLGCRQHCEISLHHHTQYSAVLRQLSFCLRICGKWAPKEAATRSISRTNRPHYALKRTSSVAVANVPGWAVNFLQLPRSIATAALEHFSRGSVRLLRSPRRKLTAPSVKTASYVKAWAQGCYAVAAKLLCGCCKAVTRLLQSCHVCRATCPTKATNQQNKEKKAAGRSLPQLGKKLQSD